MADLTNADIINAYANVPQHVIEGFGDEGDLARQYLLNPALFGLLGDGQMTWWSAMARYPPGHEATAAGPQRQPHHRRERRKPRRRNHDVPPR